MPLSRSRSRFATALLVLATPLVAHAQVESGRVIDDSTLAPLVGSRVTLQHDTAGAWATVESTRTDAQGLFQFAAHAPGVYRVALLGKKEPLYFGGVDTLAADSMQQREFRLPIVRRGVASAYLPTEVEQEAQMMLAPSDSPDPATMRLASTMDEVNANFVVDADGHADLSTFQVVSRTDPTKVESVRQSLLSRRFRPATIGGIPVREMVEQKIRTELRMQRVDRVVR